MVAGAAEVTIVRRSLLFSMGRADAAVHVEAEPVGIVHLVVPAKASKNRLTELPAKTVAIVLTTTGVRQHVPGNLAQSNRIIQFPVRQQPRIGGDLGTVELNLEPAAKIQPQNPLFRFTHPVSHVNTPNPPITP